MRPVGRGVPLIAWPARAFVRPEPLGIALVIGPWNYPLQLLLSPLIGAMAAGCCAVLKPSEFAPHTAAAIERLIGSNYPAEYLTVAIGGRDVAEALLLEKFDAIFFTGGTRAGREVMAAASRHLTPVTLELGGKSPCIVCADTPLQAAARRIVWGKFMNAGQTCVAPDFILADRRILNPLVQAMKMAIQEFYGSDPRKSPSYGRIVNRRHVERLAALLADGRIVHGGRHDLADLYVEPTLLTEVPAGAPVMQEEIFGPILPVLEFEELHEALALLQHRPTPLALYLFTRDRAVQNRVLASTRSGGVCINDTVLHMIGKGLPFGGLGDSGMGAYHGRASFDCFTHRRPVLRRTFALDLPLRYPPPRISLHFLKKIYGFLLGR
jgi:aldehyde dehydrogenase (NAD+)